MSGIHGVYGNLYDLVVTSGKVNFSENVSLKSLLPLVN